MPNKTTVIADPGRQALTHDASLQIQGLNLNNAVFGFYNGNATAKFGNQREYYGRSVIVGIRYGFGAAPGTR